MPASPAIDGICRFGMGAAFSYSGIALCIAQASGCSCELNIPTGDAETCELESSINRDGHAFRGRDAFSASLSWQAQVEEPDRNFVDDLQFPGLGLDPENADDAADYDYVFSSSNFSLVFARALAGPDGGPTPHEVVEVDLYQLDSDDPAMLEGTRVPLIDANPLLSARRSGDLDDVAATFKELVAERREEGGAFGIAAHCSALDPEETLICSWSTDGAFARSGEASIANFRVLPDALFDQAVADVQASITFDELGELELDVKCGAL